MERNLKQQAEQMAVRSARQSKSRHLLAIPAVLVAAVTALMLMSPALAMERTAVCGKEEHVHEDACYEQALICGFEDGQEIIPETEDGAEAESHEHRHTDVCYGPVLVCGIEEHVHDDSCYADEAAEGEDLLVAASPEPVCGIEEHTHEEACYNENGELACGKEAHTHSIDCLADPAETEADAETGDEVETVEPDIATPETAAPETGDTVEIEEDTAPLEMQTVKIFEDKQVRITATYDPDALPEGAEIEAFPITPETYPEEYAQMLESIGISITVDEETGEQKTGMPVVLYNIGFYSGEEEVEPESPVDITIKFLDKAEFEVGDSMTVVHFAADGTEALENETSSNNAASFQTGSFSPFLLLGGNFPLLQTGEGEVKENLLTKLYAFIDNTGVETTSDLGNSVTSFKMTGPEGPVENGGSLVNGAEYHIQIEFSETPELQFAPDGNRELLYHFPEGMKVGAVSGGEGHIQVKGTDGTITTFDYTYYVDDDGVLHMNMAGIPEGVLNSLQGLTLTADLDTTFYSENGDDIQIPVKDSEELTFHVNKSAKPKVTKTAGNYTVERNGDKTTYKQHYSVEIEAANGPLNEAYFEDEIHVASDYADSDKLVLEYTEDTLKDITITIYGADGQTRTVSGADLFREGKLKLKTKADGRTGFIINPLPNLAKGEKMVVEYYAKMTDDAVTELETQRRLNGAGQNNEVLLKDGPDGGKLGEDEKTVHFNFDSLIKTGEANDNGTITWTVEFNDGLDTHDYLAHHVEVTDTLSDNDQSFTKDGQHVGDGLGVYVEYRKEDDQIDYVLVETIPWDSVQFSDDGKTITYNMPDKDSFESAAQVAVEKAGGRWIRNYAVRVQYSTYFDADPTKDYAVYKNTVKSTFNNTNYEDGTEVEVGVPGGEVTKTVLNPDTVTSDGYVRFQVTVSDIPVAGLDGKFLQYLTKFYFEDRLKLVVPYSNSTIGYVDNIPEHLTVTLKQGDGDPVPLDPHTTPYGDDAGGAREQLEEWRTAQGKGRGTTDSFSIGGRGLDNAYLMRTQRDPDTEGNIKNSEYGMFYLVFNNDNVLADWASYLYIKETATLTVTYDIPLSANVYDRSTGKPVRGENGELVLGEWLRSGAKLDNKATAHLPKDNKETSVQYRLPEYTKPVTKNGTYMPDGTVEYHVQFKNWSTDEKGDMVLGADGKKTADLIKERSVLEALTFTDDFDDRMEYVPGSLHIDVLNHNDKICAQYYPDDGISPQAQGRERNVDLWATADQFTVRQDPLNEDLLTASWLASGEDKWGDWSKGNYPDFVSGVMAHTNNDTYYSFVFVYSLKPKDNAFKDTFDSYVQLNNTASVKSGDIGGETQAKVDYPTGTMKKSAEQDPNNTDILHFTVNMNANHIKLMPPEAAAGQKLTLHDKMSPNLSLLRSTLKVSKVTGQVDEEGNDILEDLKYEFAFDDENNEMIISGLPDETYIRITYDAQIQQLGDNVETSNEVWLGDVKGTQTEFEHYFDVDHSSIIGTGDLGYINLYKVDNTGGTVTNLKGAKFLLYITKLTDDTFDPRHRNMGQIALDEHGEPVAANTYDYHGQTYYLLGVKDGDLQTAYIQSTDDAMGTKIESGFFIKNYTGEAGYSFILVEVASPAGYMLPEGDEAVTEFVFGKGGTQVGEGIPVLPNDGIVSIENTPYSTELPKTGGPGTTAYTVSGLALLGMAAWLYRRRRAHTH